MSLRAWWRGRRYHRDNWRAVEDDQWAAQLRADLHAVADAVEPRGSLDEIFERLGHESYAWGPPMTQPVPGYPRPLICDRGHRIRADGSHLDTPDPDEITGPPVVQPDLGVAAALPGPPPGEPTADDLGSRFMTGLEDHMARKAPAMWAEWYEDYATLRFREFMAQWFGAR